MSSWRPEVIDMEISLWSFRNCSMPKFAIQSLWMKRKSDEDVKIPWFSRSSCRWHKFADAGAACQYAHVKKDNLLYVDHLRVKVHHHEWPLTCNSNISVVRLHKHIPCRSIHSSAGTCNAPFPWVHLPRYQWSCPAQRHAQPSQQGQWARYASAQ